jgi:hypothetical protein
MSTPLQLAFRIQDTINQQLREISRLSDSDTWVGPVALISHIEIMRVKSLLSSCVDLLRAHHDSSGL